MHWPIKDSTSSPGSKTLKNPMANITVQIQSQQVDALIPTPLPPETPGSGGGGGGCGYGGGWGACTTLWVGEGKGVGQEKTGQPPFCRHQTLPHSWENPDHWAMCRKPCQATAGLLRWGGEGDLGGRDLRRSGGWVNDGTSIHNHFLGHRRESWWFTQASKNCAVRSLHDASAEGAVVQFTVMCPDAHDPPFRKRIGNHSTTT